MYFNCDISNITTEQIAICSAIQTLFHEQSMPCIVTSLKPMSFECKQSLTPVMRERLLKNRVPIAINGYTAELEGTKLVVSKAKPVQSTKR